MTKQSLSKRKRAKKNEHQNDEILCSFTSSCPWCTNPDREAELPAGLVKMWDAASNRFVIVKEEVARKLLGYRR